MTTTAPDSPAVTAAASPLRVALVGLVTLGAALALPALLVPAPVQTTAAVLGLVAGLVLVTSPQRALLALVALSPFEALVSDSASPLVAKAAGALLVVAYLLQVLTRPRAVAPPSRLLVLLPLAALVGLLVASTALHADSEGALSTAVRYLGFAFVAFVGAALLQRDGAIRQVLQVLVVSCTAAAVTGLWSFLSGATPRVDGPLDDPNDLGFFCALAVPLALLLARRARPLTRGLWWLAAVLCLLGAAGTLSRGAGLALAAVLCWGVVSGLLRLRTVALAGGAVALVVAGLVTALPQVFEPALEQKGAVAGRNVDTRALRWAAAVEMTAENPLLGVGPGGFRLAYAGYEDPGRPDDETDVVAHQMYLETAAELGVPALVAFLLLLGGGWRGAAHAARAAGGDDDERDVALAVQAGLLVTAAAGLFLTEQYYLPLWLLVGAGIALGVRSRTTA